MHSHCQWPHTFDGQHPHPLPTEGIDGRNRRSLVRGGGREEFHAVGRRTPGHTFWQIPLTGLGEAVAERAGFPGRKMCDGGVPTERLGVGYQIGRRSLRGMGRRREGTHCAFAALSTNLTHSRKAASWGVSLMVTVRGDGGPRGGTTDRPADPPPPRGRSSMVTEGGLRARGGLGHHHYRPPTRRSAPRRPVAEKGDRLPEVNEDDRHLPAQGGAVAEPAERQTAKRGGGTRPKTTRIN